MKMDKGIKHQIDGLYAKLAMHLLRLGKKYVNDNYYLIESFVNTLLDYNFHLFLKEKSHINIDAAIREWVYKAGLPNNMRMIISYFVKNSLDIVGAFDRYLTQLSSPIGQFDKVLVSDPQTKVELAREYNSRYESEYLTIRVYKNTSVSGLAVFLEKHGRVIKDWLPKIKQTYPHSKKGKVDYFQKLKQIVADYEKVQAKISNLSLKENSSDYKPDKDTEIAGLVLGEDYYKIRNTNKGANILRSRRTRLHRKLQK